MRMMGHDDFIIHQRRAKFASDRRDFRLLPVEGSVAYSGKRNPLSAFIGAACVWLALGSIAYMLARIVFSAAF